MHGVRLRFITKEYNGIDVGLLSRNMKKAKPEHRIDYWKYHVAAHSFEHAQGVAHRLQTIKNVDPLFLPLMLSLHVLYARPFKHEKESRRIDPAFVPEELASVHEMLLRMRDKIFAHHDKDSKITDADTGVDLFQLVVEINDGVPRPGVQLVYPTGFQLGKVQTLCGELYRICMNNAQEAFSKCITEVPSDGLYRVSTDFQERAPLLIQSEFSSEQSLGHLKETRRQMPDSVE